MLETVTGLTGAGHRVEVLLPDTGPLVAALEAVGARVTITPVLVLRKSLLKPRGWPRLLSLALRGGAPDGACCGAGAPRSSTSPPSPC